MASLFMDGFDHVTNATMSARKWTTATGGAYVTGRFGRGQAFSINANANLLKTFNTSISTVVVGMAVQFNAPNGANQAIAIRDTGTTQCSIAFTNDYKLSVYNGNGASLLGASNIIFKANTWYFVELKVTIHNTAGTVDMRINGTSVLSLINVNTRSTANNTANQVFITNGTFGNAQILVDDVYIFDTTGSVNNDFIGEIEIRQSYPTSDSAVQFTPSTGVNNFANVDDTNPNDDTDYNESSTLGQKDIYGLTAMSPVPTTVKAVAVTSCWRNAQAGSRSGRNFITSSGVTANGATTAIGSSFTMQQDMFDVDPNGAIAWTVSSANAITPGVEVTA